MHIYVLSQIYIYFFSGYITPANGQEANNFLTQTVYGFLDFTTTIGNTVMVFSPHSAPPPGYTFILLYFYFKC